MLLAPIRPASAAIVDKGAFVDDAHVSCSGSGASLSCGLSINEITTCTEFYGDTVGLWGCRLYFSDGDPLLMRGTATPGNLACTAGLLEPSKVLIIKTHLGEFAVGVTATYSGSAGSGHGTLYGVRHALAYTVAVQATITNVNGCGQDSGFISGTYTITT